MTGGPLVGEAAGATGVRQLVGKYPDPLPHLRLLLHDVVSGLGSWCVWSRFGLPQDPASRPLPTSLPAALPSPERDWRDALAHTRNRHGRPFSREGLALRPGKQPAPAMAPRFWMGVWQHVAVFPGRGGASGVVSQDIGDRGTVPRSLGGHGALGVGVGMRAAAGGGPPLPLALVVTWSRWEVWPSSPQPCHSPVLARSSPLSPANPLSWCVVLRHSETQGEQEGVSTVDGEL